MRRCRGGPSSVISVVEKVVGVEAANVRLSIVHLVPGSVEDLETGPSGVVAFWKLEDGRESRDMKFEDAMQYNAI